MTPERIAELRSWVAALDAGEIAPGVARAATEMLDEIEKLERLRESDIVHFLLGSAPLDGVWFGDPHPSRKGRFWWRQELRSALDGGAR